MENKKKRRKKNILSLDALPPPREPAPAAFSDPGSGGLNIISSNMLTFGDFDNLESDPCLQDVATGDKKKTNNNSIQDNNNNQTTSKREEADAGKDDNVEDVMLVSLKKKPKRSSPKTVATAKRTTTAAKQTAKATTTTAVAARQTQAIATNRTASRTPATLAEIERHTDELFAKATSAAAGRQTHATKASASASSKRKETSSRKKVPKTHATTVESHTRTPELVYEEEDLPGDMAGVSPLESDMLKKLDRDIFRAEEQDLLEDLDNVTFLAEESWMLGKLSDDIKGAITKYEQPGGRVVLEWNVDRLSDDMMQIEREWDAIDKEITFADQMELSSKLQCELGEIDTKNKSRVLDVDNLGNEELTVRTDFPKYIGSTENLLLTQEQLRKALITGIAGSVRVTLKNKEDDPYTVVVEVCGRGNDVDKVKTCLIRLVRAKQLRYLAIKRAELTNPETDATKKPHSRAQARHIQKYREFEVRYQKMRDLEFGGIHARSVWGSMWQAHKNLGFGSSCSGACRCFMHLDRLTDTVIDEHMKKMRKKNPDSPRPRVVGFASQFAPKFMPMLRMEFPNELNEQLFERLVLMWSRHIQQQRFGTTCEYDCSCLEGWASVFKKGRLGEAKKVTEEPSKQVAAVRRISSAESRPSLASAPGQRSYEIDFDTRHQLGFFVITKKRGQASVVKILSVNGATKDPRLFPETIVSHASLVGSNTWHIVQSHNDLKKLYENCKRSFSKIRIRFINMDVKAVGNHGRANDGNWTTNLAWKGKANLDGWAGGATSSRDLVSSRAAAVAPVIEAASRDQQFPESNVFAPQHHERSSVTRYSENVVDSSASAHENPSGRMGTTRQEKPFAVGRSDAPNIPPPASGSPDTQEKWLERREPNHRGLPAPKPILRDVAPKKPQERQGSVFRKIAGLPKKKADTTIRWNKHELEDICLFWPNGRSIKLPKEPKRADMTTASEVKPRKPSDKEKAQTSNRDLLNAIKTKSCVEVYKKLLAGASTRPEGVEPKDDRNYPELVAKGVKVSRENNLRSDHSHEAQRHLQDARMKITLLKTFEKMRAVAVNSMGYKRWGRFVCRIDRIEDLEVEEAACVATGDKFTCQVTIRDEDMGNTAPKDFDKAVKYIDGSGSHSRFAFHFHPTLTIRPTFVLTMQKVVKRGISNARQVDQPEPMNLAQEEIQLLKLANAADVRETDFPVDVTPTKFMKSARAVMVVQRVEIDTKRRIAKEREKWRWELNQILSDISQFNADPARESLGLQEFDVNLPNPVYPHITLLHAAVYLDDVRAVHKLVEMKANMDRKSPQGLTPRKLALYLFSEKKASKQLLEELGITAEEYEEKLEEYDQTGNEMQDGHHTESLKEPRSEGSSIDQFSPSSRVETTSQHAPHSNPSQGSSVVNEEAARPREHGQIKREGEPELLGKRDRGPENISPQNRKVAKRASFRKERPDMSLPDMSIEDMLNGRGKCRYYNRGGRGGGKSCARGRACKYAHLEVVDPDAIDQQEMKTRPQYNHDHLRIQFGMGRNGQRCCTPLYWDDGEDVFIQAIGGNTLGINTHGVWWYRNKHDAVDVIERAIAIYQKSQQEPERHPAINFTPARRSSSTIAGHPAGRVDTSNALGGAVVDEAETRAFKKLMKNPNHSVTFAALVRREGKGVVLRKNDWTTRELRDRVGWVNVSFTPWIAENLPATRTFSSGKHGAAINGGGVWYHPGLNEAKASAFLEFLKFLRDLGILHSLEESIDMRRLPYAK